MDAPRLISLGDVVLRDDLDPRLGERDDDLIQQYAEIFDALPPIEINQDNELIDGWHRVRAAERAERSEIAYVVVETDGDDDLSDKMWAANLKHGVQYTRVQRQTQGLRLHERGLKAKQIAERVGVGASSVYRWTREYREKQKQERDAEIERLRDEGMTTREIADKVDLDHATVARALQNSQMGNLRQQPESEAELEVEAAEADTGEEPEMDLQEIPESEPAPAETATAEPQSVPEPAVEEPSAAEATTDHEAAAPESEPDPLPPKKIPDPILEAARAVMVGFVESRPDAYVARLEVSPTEWMTITDDSLSNELECELLTSAGAMCFWQDWMIWYQGGRTGAFTDAFGVIGPVFVRGRSGQWTIASRLRSILRRLWE